MQVNIKCTDCDVIVYIKMYSGKIFSIYILLWFYAWN